MKNTITLLALLLFGISSHAQKHTFGKKYLELSQPSQEENESIMVKKLNNKDLKELIATSEPKDNSTEKEVELFLKGKSLFEQAKDVLIVMDIENQLSFSQIKELLEPYEELVSMKNEELVMEVRGLMKKDKISELVALFLLGDEMAFFVDISFKKPIALEDYMEDPTELSQLFKFDTTKKVENDDLISFSHSKEEHFDSASPKLAAMYQSSSFKLDIVKENGVYGVKMFSDGGDEYIINPQYNKKPILYGTNPGETYINAHYNEKDYYLLYDKYGFTIAHGDEITPVYVPNSEELAFFIIRWDDRYGLYECPPKYELIREDKYNLRPHIEYRLTGCSLIELKENNTLECIKENGETELITIRNKN